MGKVVHQTNEQQKKVEITLKSRSAVHANPRSMKPRGQPLWQE